MAPLAPLAPKIRLGHAARGAQERDQGQDQDQDQDHEHEHMMWLWLGNGDDHSSSWTFETLFT